MEQTIHTQTKTVWLGQLSVRKKKKKRNPPRLYPWLKFVSFSAVSGGAWAAHFIWHQLASLKLGTGWLTLELEAQRTTQDNSGGKQSTTCQRRQISVFFTDAVTLYVSVLGEHKNTRYTSLDTVKLDSWQTMFAEVIQVYKAHQTQFRLLFLSL